MGQKYRIVKREHKYNGTEYELQAKTLWTWITVPPSITYHSNPSKTIEEAEKNLEMLTAKTIETVVKEVEV